MTVADGTQIEWTSATWNIITGCMVKSPGCIHCYAQLLAGTRLKHHPSRANLTREVNGHHVWTGEVRFNEQWLDQPLRWKRPRDIFVVAHGDLAYERVPNEWLDRIFAVMARAPQHRFQVLTKRPERLADYLCTGQTARRLSHEAPATLIRWPLPNVWIGASVERQREADERRVSLAKIADWRWNTWVSYEPALGPVDWSGWESVKWMVSGGESDHGGNARPSHPDWHRATRDWCAANSIPYFFKQWGDWAPFATSAFYGPNEIVGGDCGGPDQLSHIQDDRGRRIKTGFVEAAWPDGTRRICELRHMPTHTWGRNDQQTMTYVHVGKARAGALLDGVAHKEMPR